MPLTALPQSVNVGRPMTLISRDKENQHKKTKIIATSASQPRLRRRRRVHSTQLPPPASRVAHGVAVAHAAMRRLKRQGRKQRDQPHASHLPPQSSNSESEPMSIELIDTPEPSTSQQPQQQEQAIKPAVSGLKYNFPRFLPRYPMPAIKAEALAAIDEQLRDIPIQFILDDILINLAPVIQRGLAAVSTETANVGLQTSPDRVTLFVRDLEGPLRLPTHVLGVTDKTRKELQLFPMHDVLFASHCAYLPYLHAPEIPLEVETHGNGAMTLTVPVIHYELPDPKSFHLLYTYLYRHDVNQLLGALLPPLPPTLIQYVVATTQMSAISGRASSLYGPLQDDEDSNSSDSEEQQRDEENQDGAMSDAESESSSRTTSPPRSPTGLAPTSAEPTPTPQQKRQQTDLNKLAQLLANTFALPRLLQQARLIHGVWSNVIMLGIADIGMWNAMDYAWSATMKALVIATETLRRQQQQQLQSVRA